MADTKLSALTALAVEAADTDEYYLNDGSTSKRQEYSVLKAGILTGTAATVTTNANLTGIVTSTGNATAIADDAIAVTKLTKGTASQQIRTNAGGTAVEWFTPSGGAGDFLADGTVDMTGQFRTDVGTFDSDVADGASAVAYDFDTQSTYSTAGANLQRWRNNSTVVFDLSFQGGLDHVNSGASTAGHSQSLNLNWVATGTQAASGQYSAAIGQNNTASNTAAMAFGATNVASASKSTAMGSGCTASGTQSFALGTNSVASTTYATALGYQASADLATIIAFSAGRFSATGDAQTLIACMRISTTDATQTALGMSDSSGARLTVPADTSWCFSALVIGRSNEADGNDSAAYRVEGCIARDESSNTALVGSVTVTTLAESAGAAAWGVTATADDTNEALLIQVTGEAATTVRWVASVTIASVTLA